MNKLIAIVGMCGSGKSVATDFFKNKGFEVVYFGGVTMEKLKEENIAVTPENEKIMREALRKKYGMSAYATILLPKIKKLLEKGNVVLDGVYSWSELKVLLEEFPFTKTIAIVNNKKIRYERLNNREIRPFTYEEAVRRDISEIENLEKGGPIVYADYYILNNSSLEEYTNNLKTIYNSLEEM